MASFSEIEKQNNPKTTIINYLKEYSEKTGRNVIVYSSSFLTTDQDEVYIDEFDKVGFMTVVKDLNTKKGLDLILHTPGGEVNATESIIDYLHAVFGKNIRAVVPQIAMSGGTMIACSCKEILMGEHSSLGPVDPQILDVSAKSIIKEHDIAKKEIIEQPESIPFWEILLNKYPENTLIECKNAIKWSEFILDKSLKYSMFENNQKQIDKIKEALITGETTKDHSQNLSLSKCKDIGLNVKNLENDETLHELVLSIHNACLSYFNHKLSSKLFLNQKGQIFTTYEHS